MLTLLKMVPTAVSAVTQEAADVLQEVRNAFRLVSNICTPNETRWPEELRRNLRRLLGKRFYQLPNILGSPGRAAG